MLEEYEKDRPILEHNRVLIQRFQTRDRDCEDLDRGLKIALQENLKENSRWELNTEELGDIPFAQGAKNKAPQSIDPKEYSEMVQQLLNNLLKYNANIPGLMKRYRQSRASLYQQGFFQITDESAQRVN